MSRSSRAAAIVAAVLPLATALIAVAPSAGAATATGRQHSALRQVAAERYRPAMRGGVNPRHYNDPQLGGSHTISEDIGGLGWGQSTNVSQTPGSSTGSLSGTAGQSTVATSGSTEYIVDSNANVIRAVDLQTGNETIFAGTGGTGDTGDGGAAHLAEIGGMTDIATDSLGNVYVSASGGVRMIATVAGTYFGTAMSAGDIYTVAAGDDPGQMAVDAAGNLLMAGGGPLRVLANVDGTYYGVQMTTGSTYSVGAATDSLGSVAIEAGGSLVLGNAKSISLLTPTGAETRIAGGAGSGPATMLANDPQGIVATGTDVEIVDGGSGMIRSVDLATGQETELGGSSATAGAPGSFPAGDAAGDLFFTAYNASNELAVEMVPASSGSFYGQQMTAGDLYTIFTDTGADPPCALEGSSIVVDPSGDLWYESGDKDVCEIANTGGPLSDGTVVFTAGANQYWWGGATWTSAGIVVAGYGLLYFYPFTSGSYYGQTMTTGQGYVIAGQLDEIMGDTGNGFPATEAEINDSFGVTADAEGNLFFEDMSGYSIREVAISPATEFGITMCAGCIYQIAGTGYSGFPETGGPADQTPIDATGYGGFGLDPSDDVYFGDRTGVYEVAASSDDLSLVAGDGDATDSLGGLPALSTQLAPTELGVDAAGNVLADSSGGTLFVFAQSTGTDYGIQMTAGYGYVVPGYEPGAGDDVVGTDAAGDVFSASAADSETLPDGDYGTAFTELTEYTAGPTSLLGQSYPAGANVVVAGNGHVSYSGDGAPAVQSEIDSGAGLDICPSSNDSGMRGTIHGTQTVGPCGVPADGTAVDSAGDVAIADGGNGAVRFVPAASGTYFGIRMTAGDIYTIAGGGSGSSPTASGVPALGAGIEPLDVAFDDYGNLYLTAQGTIDMLPAVPNTPFGTGLTVGDIYAIAGGGTSTADGVQGTSEEISSPCGLSIDASGDLVFTQEWPQMDVRLLAASSGTRFGQNLVAGDIYTIAGEPEVADVTSTGTATEYALSYPTGVAADLSDDVFVADTGHDQVLVLTPSGNLQLLAGDGTRGDFPTGTTQVQAGKAELDVPTGLAVDWDGDVFISDAGNDVVREVDIAGDIATVAGDGTTGLSGDGGPATSAELSDPAWLSLDTGGDMLLTDSGNDRIRVVQGVGSPGPEAGPCGGAETFGSGDSPDAACMAASESHLLGPESGSVSTLNGEYSLSYPLFSIPNRGGKLDVSLEYNSASAATTGPAGPVGNGFSLLPLGSLSVDTPTGNVTVDAGDGSSVTFKPEVSGECDPGYVGNGSYCAPDRVEATLTEPTSGTFLEVLNRTITDTYTLESGSTTAGLLQSNKDLEGDTTTYAYNSSNQLTSITDPAGRQFTFAWNSAGEVSTVTDVAMSRTYDLAYTGNDLTSVTDPLDRVTSFGYNSSGQVSTVTAPNAQTGGPDAGDSTSVSYNASGEVTSAKDPAGRVTSFGYVGSNSTLFGGTTTVTDPDGNVTLDVFHLGELVASTTGVGTEYAATTHFSYDPVTTLLTGERDPDGYSTSYTWDALGELLQRVDPDGGITSYTYDALGDELSVTDPMGNTTTDTYNADGDILTSSTPLGNGATAVTTYRYGSTTHPGEVTAEVDPDHNTTTYVYDVDGDVQTITDPMGGVTKKTYDKDGNLLTSTDPMLLETKWTYDADGEVLTVTDPAKGVTTYTYDANGDKLSVVDPKDRKTSYTYDADDEMLTKTDPLSRVTKYGYDGDGNQTSVEDPLLHTTSTSYGPNGIVLSATDALGYSATYSYDADGRKLSSKDPDGDVTLFTYEPDGKLATETAPGGGTTTYTYDPDDELLSVQAPLGGVQSYTYDMGGRKISSTTPDEYTTQYSYDDDGNLLTTTDPTGEVTTRAYDKDDRVTSISDLLGDKTSYTYDADGRVATMTPPDGNASTTPAAYTTTYGYDALGNTTTVTVGTGSTARTTKYGYDADSERTSVETPLLETTTTAYDADGLVTKVTDPLGHVTTYAYDADGRKISETDPDKGVTKWTYDVDGHVKSVTDPVGHVVSSTYFPNGWLKTSKDGDGNVTTYTYYPNGKTQSETDAAGDETRYSYDLDLRIVTLENPSTGTYTYGYDPDGNVTSLTDPLSRTTSHTYDADDRLLTTTDPESRVATYTYDKAGRLSGVSYSDGLTPDVTYTYDPSGERHTMTDGTGTSTYVYDPFGEMTSYQDGAGSTVGYGYNADGELTTLTYPNTDAVTYSYDADGRLSTVKDWLGQTSTYTYNNDGDVTGLSMGGSGDSVVTVRDGDGNASSVALQGSGGASLIALANTFDANSNLTSQVATGAIASSTTYSYDKADRLVGQGTTTPAPTNTYTYTPAGYATTLLGNVAQTFDAAGEVTTHTPPSGPPVTYGYDSLGERTTATSSAGSTTYGWNEANTMTSLTSAGATTTYTYDGDGLRMSSTSGGVTTPYTWDIQSSLPHLLTDGSNAYVYGVGDTPIEQISLGTSTASFLFEDQLGSVRAVVASNGTVAATATYDAYGTVAAGGVSSYTPFGFAGGETDPTGLIYLVNRYYDPSTAQFLTVDALVTTTDQPYEYGGDNPTDNTDPNGNMFCAGGRCGSIQYLEHPPVYTPAQVAAMNHAENLEIEQGQLQTILANTHTAMGAQFQALGKEYFASDNLQQEQQAQGGLRGLVADVSASLGDFLTFGLGGLARNALISGLGRLNPVNEQSAAYQITSDVVMVASLVDPIGDAADMAESAEKADDAAQAAMDAGDVAKAATEMEQATTDTNAAIDHLAQAQKDVEEELGTVEQELNGTDASGAVGTEGQLALPEGSRSPPEAAGAPVVGRYGSPGERFNMVYSENQVAPGGFGTFDEVPDQAFAREKLAIRPDWKPDVSYVQQFEFPSEGLPIPIQESVAGPQEFGGITYPGGASQLEILNYEDRERLIPIGEPQSLEGGG